MTARTILCFDYGTKSIGVAVGSELTGSATLLAALKAKDGIPDWQQIERLIQEWQPQLLLVGLPLNMDGSEQEFTARTRKFANRLHGRFGLPIAYHDERLSTADARSRLFAEGGYRNLSKDKVDSLSAQIIFEGWYEQQG
ncbi:Holliday junction resolvase-like protein [Alishewanella agri BL06]|jgi:putative Holliday junction resolvase|uniref:Putative pre-16S rRNA nuclease n=1 Tax=Alishewanella agri BL06 TaxID=1195246 RepID=I8UEB2_9ALTE|nr:MULTISPECIES: Holliday junction resolvase RuvX [Alishewanella]EIW90323.1 Holliday junction resolvase-like protein [Alishewanella agri BL06]OCW98132.1 Holliday junction DNA helicase RuvA [Alishewanella sp. HH-ZS]OZB35486.1 MAG: Holliday junction resolvase RuvX [Alishewanella sp. 34-51-39]